MREGGRLSAVVQQAIYAGLSTGVSQSGLSSAEFAAALDIVDAAGLTESVDPAPSLTIAVRGDRAGVRKPPRKETASRTGVAAAATYGDLRVAGVCCRAVGMTIKDDFEG